jgi:hypothetical protein
MWGVFFRDQGEVEEYLAGAYEDEEEAQEAAEARDQQVFEQVMEEAEGDDDPTWEDYEGMHYVEPIARSTVEEVQGQLDRGFVVRVG